MLAEDSSETESSQPAIPRGTRTLSSVTITGALTRSFLPGTDLDSHAVLLHGLGLGFCPVNLFFYCAANSRHRPRGLPSWDFRMVNHVGGLSNLGKRHERTNPSNHSQGNPPRNSGFSSILVQEPGYAGGPVPILKNVSERIRFFRGQPWAWAGRRSVSRQIMALRKSLSGVDHLGVAAGVRPRSEG